MLWGPQQWLIEHIYLKNLSNLCRNEWETIVWSFAATTAQKSSGMAAVPTILKTAIKESEGQKVSLAFYVWQFVLQSFMTDATQAIR